MSVQTFQSLATLTVLFAGGGVTETASWSHYPSFGKTEGAETRQALDHCLGTLEVKEPHGSRFA